jgi:hypothetical protein
VRCCFEDFVLGGGFLELELKALILFCYRGRVLFEGGEFSFEVFDMTLFTFAKGSLAEMMLTLEMEWGC